MRRFVLSVLCLAFTSAASAADPPRFEAVAGDHEFSGRMMVRPMQPNALAGMDVPKAQAEARIASARALIEQYRVLEYIPQTDEYIIAVPDGTTENDLADLLMATGNFQYAHPDWIVYPVVCPNDPRLPSQWHHDADRLDSCAAWDFTVGAPGIGVGICDTGVRTTHEDLQLHRLEGYNAVTQLWESQGGLITPVHGHGTATTGCAAANGDNGVGISGVGQVLSHRMLRVSNVSSGSSSLAVLTHAARISIESGDRVASVSYTGVSNGTVVATAAYVKSIGGLLVWAAGNDSRNLTFGDRDADDLIVVGATDSSDRLASFSAFGPFVDLVAPGVNVYTLSNSGNAGYGGASGTSFACPLTAGLIALIWSADPGLTPDEVEAILKEGVDDLGVPGVDDTFGYGRINSLGSVSLTNTPLSFEYPQGIPDTIDPRGGARFRVEVLPSEMDPMPGTGRLHYDDGSGYQVIDMLVISPHVYDAVFPAFTCGIVVDFYVSAETTTGEVITHPLNAPSSHRSATAIVGTIVVFSDNFEQNTGWTAENLGAATGDWQRGVPVNDPSWAYDPISDSDGSGRCYVTQNQFGNTDVDDGAVRLTSPTLDMSTPGFAVSYDYYLRLTNQNGVDRLLVEINSDNGAGPWTQIALHTTDGGLSWRTHVITEADIIAVGVQPNATMRMRFTANDSDPQSINESGIDAFKIFLPDCGVCYADCDQSGVLDIFDFLCFQNSFLLGEAYACDCDPDPACDIFDFLCFQDAFVSGCP
ncbi:MAG: S8 family serine peptidase [Planctomycetes bacterium]|nr:S8 family serine peptidase [Planctomycetota bacterium]